MTKTDRTDVNASQLRAFLEIRHGAPAMTWRNQFALACWLYFTGQARAADKILTEVVETVREYGNHAYLDALYKEAKRNPLSLAVSVGPHSELISMFKEAVCAAESGQAKK